MATERKDEREDPISELSWEINLNQVNKLVEGLEAYPRFHRVRAKPGGAKLPANYVVWYVEPLTNYALNILVEQTEQNGVFILTAQRGAAPVIRDILGTDLPRVFFPS